MMEPLFVDTPYMENYQHGSYGSYGDPLQYSYDPSSYSTGQQYQAQPGSEYCHYQNGANLDQLLYSEVGDQNAAVIVLGTDQQSDSCQSYPSEATFYSEDSNVTMMTFANEADLLSYLSTFEELKNIQVLPVASEMENTEKSTAESISAPMETTASPDVDSKELPIPNQPVPQAKAKKTTTKSRKRSRTQLVYENSAFVCEPCDRTFGRRSSLAQHNNVHHSGPREHRCDECGKRYRTLEELHCHVQRHVAHDKPYKCADCPRQFNYRQDLDRHRAVRHGVAKHECRHCGKRMARRDFLMAHEAIHTRRNRFQELGK